MKKDEKTRIQRARGDLYAKFRYLGAYLAEQYFQKNLHHLSPEMLEERNRRITELILGGPDGFGILQYVLDAETNGLLSALSEDFPYLKKKVLLIFSYSAAGFSNELSAHLTGLSGQNAVAVIKCRLRDVIQTHASPRREAYLAMLPKKGCRIGEEILSLHDK